jgi:NAD(P)-dependent dehydrogenase (short-subunit alcohol dehydrogenase family)
MRENSSTIDDPRSLLKKYREMTRTEKNLFLAAGAGLLTLGLIAAFRAARPRYNVNGKVALVTGGSRGLGLLLARELASEGAKVAICARNSEELRKAEILLKKYSEHILPLQCDLLDVLQIKGMFESIRNTWDPVEILVNNAGIILSAPVETLSVEDFELSMKTHFWAPLLCIREVLPDMMHLRAGRIINISSIGGKVPVPHLLPYTASKFALTGLSEGLYTELKKFSITVTTVCPSLMQTGSAIQAFVKGKKEKEFALFASAAAMPGFSMDAEIAAKKIFRSIVRGDGELLLGWPSKIAAAVHGISPEMTLSGMSAINSLLPGAEKIPDEVSQGKTISQHLIPSFLRKKLNRASLKYNEI